MTRGKAFKRRRAICTILVGGLFLSTQVVAANEKDAGSTASAEVSMEVALVSRIHEIEFLDSSLENSVVFRPNVPYITEVQLFYKEHQLRLETDNLFDIGVDDDKGDSSYGNIKYSFSFEKNRYSVYYGNYKGFYVANQRDASGDFFVFDNIKTKRYGLEFVSYRSEPRMVTVNNRYPVNYNELPNYFGTVTYGLLFDVSTIKNIPSDPTDLSQIDNSQSIFFNNMELVTLAPFVGVIGRLASSSGYFIESGLNLGYGLQTREFDLDGIKTDDTDASLVGTFFASIGKTMRNNSAVGVLFSVESVEPTVGDYEFGIATVNTRIFVTFTF